jgi:predicted transcriptional regulator
MPEKDCTRACRERATTPADLSIRQQEDRDDFDVLTILLHREDHHGLWSMEELGRDRKNPLTTQDAVNRLLRAGLVNRHGEYVFPTRAATRYSQIVW